MALDDIPEVEAWLDTLIVLPETKEDATTAVENFLRREV